MATIRDVAAKANVSSSTVSHVINNTRFVSETTQARVLEAMKELAYNPNRLARSLRVKGMQTNTIGLLIPDNANPLFAELLEGVESACFDADYNVILCISNDLAEKEMYYLNVLLGKQVDGIILVSSGSASESVELLKQNDCPVVLVDREFENVDVVVVDNEGGGYLAVKHLIDLGHSRIGCISGPSQINPSALRCKGYHRALEDAKIIYDPTLLTQGDFRPHSGYLAAKELLSLPEPPTAIFISNDMMAMGALCAINELGLSVPKNVSIVGFDDVSLASMMVPPLTTISQPTHELGSIAVEMLTKRIKEPSAQPNRMALKTSLVIRKSASSISSSQFVDHVK